MAVQIKKGYAGNLHGLFTDIVLFVKQAANQAACKVAGSARALAG